MVSALQKFVMIR